MSDDFNMSMRKFLKQVGVTSQRAIEEAMRDPETAGRTFDAKVVLTIDGIDLEHVVTGRIVGRGTDPDPDPGDAAEAQPS